MLLNKPVIELLNFRKQSTGDKKQNTGDIVCVKNMFALSVCERPEERHWQLLVPDKRRTADSKFESSL